MSKNFRNALFDSLSPEYEEKLSAQTSEHSFSPEFEKKMEKLVKRRSKPYYKLINSFGKRVACVAATLLIASSVTILSVDAFRESFANMIVNVYEKFSAVSSEEPTNSPDTIEDIYEITYDLSDYTVNYEEYDEYSRNISYINNDISINFWQYTKKNLHINLNTEDAEISTVNIGEYEAMYYLDNHNYDHLIWDNGDYLILLSSNIGKDELISIAKTVKKVE